MADASKANPQGVERLGYLGLGLMGTPMTRRLLKAATRGSAIGKGIGKQSFYAQIDLDQPKAYAYAIEVMASTSQLPHGQEGMHAFVEKRKPKFD